MICPTTYWGERWTILGVVVLVTTILTGCITGVFSCLCIRVRLISPTLIMATAITFAIVGTQDNTVFAWRTGGISVLMATWLLHIAWYRKLFLSVVWITLPAVTYLALPHTSCADAAYLTALCVVSICYVVDELILSNVV